MLSTSEDPQDFGATKQFFISRGADITLKTSKIGHMNFGEKLGISSIDYTAGLK